MICVGGASGGGEFGADTIAHFNGGLFAPGSSALTLGPIGLDVFICERPAAQSPFDSGKS